MGPDRLPANVTSDELKEAGVILRADNKPEARDVDLLERYRSVPNHAMFLYTSEDKLVDAYIREHWSALDGLSGNICDIHVSLMQLRGEADAYSQFGEISSIPGLDTMEPTDLPALHIWSNSASLRLLLGSFRTEQELRDVLRLIFSELRNNGGSLAHSHAEELGRKVRNSCALQLDGHQQIGNANVGRDIVQITNHFYGSRSFMGKKTAGGGESKQTIESVELVGGIKQGSDTSKAEQTIKHAKGSGIDQSVRSEKQNLSLGKYSASGRWAVIGLVVIAIIVIVFKWLAH